MFRIIFAIGAGLLGYAFGKHVDEEMSSKKSSGTPLATDAGSVPPSVSDDSGKVPDSTDNPPGDTP